MRGKRVRRLGFPVARVNQEAPKVEAALRADPWAATAADPELRTPLHYAALAGDLETVRLVLELKPERVRPQMLIRNQDAGGMTVLHSAVLSGNEALVMLLLEQGLIERHHGNAGTGSLTAAATETGLPADAA